MTSFVERAKTLDPLLQVGVVEGAIIIRRILQPLILNSHYLRRNLSSCPADSVVLPLSIGKLPTCLSRCLEKTRPATMVTSASHVTELPPGFLTVRIMQLIGTLVVLGMEAYIVAWGGGYATVASILALTTVSRNFLLFGERMLTLSSLFSH
jgi:hypothetical protein